MINPMDMTGKHILITGAGSGIGRATAILLAQLGARLTLVGRDLAKLNHTVQLLSVKTVEVQQFDFANSDDIVPWMRSCAEQYGRFDGLAHSAGIQSFNPLRSLTPKALDRLLRINTISAAMLVKAMQHLDCGAEKASIVLISSTAAMRGTPANGAYGCSKAAIISLVKTFALELVERGIRLNCIAPALVETEMVQQVRETMTSDAFQALEAKHPMGIGQPDQVASVIAFLLSNASSWITGVTIPVDGGTSV
jgi:NAD(P)-dependent dehydrogenase (short-subunit alcohol dehydrogenase family)